MITTFWRAAALAVPFLALVSCNKDLTPVKPPPETMDDLVVAPGFSWESTRTVDLTAGVSFLPLQAGSVCRISVYDGDPNRSGALIVQGIAGYQEPFATNLRVSSMLQKIWLTAETGTGAVLTDSVQVNPVIQFNFPPPVLKESSAPATDPDCSQATPPKTLTGSQTVSVTNGTSYYVTGDFSGTINFGGNGGTITVCGNMHPQSITNMGAYCYIVVSAGGTFSYAGTLEMGSGSRIYAYSTAHVHLAGVTMNGSRIWNTSPDFTVNSSLSPSGGFENYGTITVAGGFTVSNAVTTFVNSGILTVGGDFTLSHTATNNGTMDIGGTFILSGGTFYNNCKFIVHQALTLSSGNLTMNGAYLRENQSLHIDPGATLLLKNNSMVSTVDWIQSTGITGTGGASCIKVSNTGSITGTNTVSGSIQMNTPSGTLAQGGTSNFVNGAVLKSISGATIHIAVSSCNPEGIGNSVPGDTDADGVPNLFDNYPADPTRAFDSYYPSRTAYGTVAFEDLWPSKGDYDMNDLVVDYRYQVVTNAQNKVTDIRPTYYVRAAGAGLKNGFGVQFDGILAGQVASVTGCSPLNSVISTASSGVENNQEKAVAVVFDNFHNVIHSASGGGEYYNTVQNQPKGYGDTLKVQVHLAAPLPLAAVGAPPFNMFLIRDMDRGHEVHLADHIPTSLADPSLFGTSADQSIPSQGRYYKSAGNLPWALDIPSRFDYSVEKSPIIQGYLKFAEWSQSSGTLYPDWFTNRSGYRQPGNILQ